MPRQNFEAMQTITDIAAHRNIDVKSARVAVLRKYKDLGQPAPDGLTNETPLPASILTLIQNKNAKAKKSQRHLLEVAKIGKVNGSAVLESEPAQIEIQPDVTPEVKTRPAQRKREIKQVSLPEPPKVEEIQPPVEKADLLETVLNKKLTVLLALGVCIAVDGYCAGMVSEREIDTPGAFWVFGVLGIVFGFAAIYNAYRLSRKERGKWDRDPTGAWIFAFAVFQYLLHGSAFQLFSDWSDLTTQQIISRNLLCVITPLATSALSVTLFAHKKN
jgi:hypothetical protein